MAAVTARHGRQEGSARRAGPFLLLGFAAFLFGGVAGGPADATSAGKPEIGDAVDVALVLLVDVSTSVDDAEFTLQREGLARAIEDRAVIDAAASGAARGIALTIVEFSDRKAQTPVVPWHRLASSADAAAIAGLLRTVPRSSDGLTGIADALLFARAAFATSPYAAPRRVIDVSGDGLQNIGPPLPETRDLVTADGTTINGLPIIGDEPAIADYYRQDIIGGPQAFLIVAESLASFDTAMKNKLLGEIVLNAPALPAPLPRLALERHPARRSASAVIADRRHDNPGW